MTKTEELQKQIDEMRERKIEIVEGIEKSILDFVIDRCNISSEVDIKLDLDLGHMRSYSDDNMKRVRMNFYLYANGENSTIRVCFEDGKMYVRNNSIAGLSKEDDEDVVYILSYTILDYLLRDGYYTFKNLILDAVKSNVKELESISKESSLTYHEIRMIEEKNE